MEPKYFWSQFSPWDHLWLPTLDLWVLD